MNIYANVRCDDLDIERRENEETKALFNDLFGKNKVSQSATIDHKNDEYIPEMDINELVPSDKNMYSIKVDSAMQELIASVRDRGVFVPFIARKNKAYGDKLEILSGHRRRYAAIESGVEKVPVCIIDVSDEDAIIIIADSNLHRPGIPISEKAQAIAAKYYAMKKKAGKRKTAPGAVGKTTAETIAEEMGLSERTINNYIAITHLTDDLMVLVDEKKLPFKAGIQISYLDEQLQKNVYDLIMESSIRINEETAKSLREVDEEATVADLKEYLGIVSERNKSKPRKLSSYYRKKYFPKNMDDTEIQSVMEKLLKEWAEKNNPEYAGAS